jgi:hypothetical protein
MFYTDEHDAEHICLDFSGSHRRNDDMWGYNSFGVSIEEVTASLSGVWVSLTVRQIWSIRFSADGKEVIAGAGSGKIMVYDIGAQRRSLSINGHADDGRFTLSPFITELTSQSTPSASLTSRPPTSWSQAQTTATSKFGTADHFPLQPLRVF